MLLKNYFCVIQYDLYTSLTNFIQDHCITRGTMWVKYELDYSKGRKDMLRTRIFYIILLWPTMTLTFDLENGLKVITHPLLKSSVNMWSMSQIVRSGKYIYDLKKGLLLDPIWPWPLTYKRHLRSVHTLCPKTLSEISAKLDQGERRTDRWAERRKDRLINIERLQREALTIFIIFL